MRCLTNAADGGRILITYAADAAFKPRFKPYIPSHYLLIDLQKNAILKTYPVMIIHENLVFECCVGFLELSEPHHRCLLSVAIYAERVSFAITSRRAKVTNVVFTYKVVVVESDMFIH